MLRSNDLGQSDARMLIDNLRASSVHSRPFTKNGSVDEQAATLNIILEGGVLRQRVLRNGRVQTVAVYFRDDIINLSGYVNGKRIGTDYLLVLEGSIIGSVPYHVVATIQSGSTGRFDGLGTLMAREIGIAHERLISLGQRSAIEAMAHFFCEAFVRCIDPFPMPDRRAFPMTQPTLSTVLGLSLVHVNRTLRELRQRKLVDIIGQDLVIHDHKGLESLAHFDGAYLAAI